MTPNQKIYGLPLWVLAWWLSAVSSVQASWFVDERRFHMSAHGRTACVECHEDVPGRPHHPDPDGVNRNPLDFFKAERCLICHDGVEEDLAEARHGGREGVEVGRYAVCIRCHEPHSQRRLGEPPAGTFSPGIPGREPCGACHDARESLPPLSERDERCMTCHRLPHEDDPSAARRVQEFCLYCHGTGDTPARSATGRHVLLIEPEPHAYLAHGAAGCTVCHTGAASYPHADQQTEDCLRCHRRHHEKTAGDAHLPVACGSCHLKGVIPVRDPATGRVLWTVDRKPGEESAIHDMAITGGGTTCRRCHVPGNAVGAAAMVLPPKSVLCMPCHAATFSAGDATTLLALLVFFFGVLLLGSVWMTGRVSGAGAGRFPVATARPVGCGIRTVFSATGLSIAKTLLLDVLLQRRLYRRSRGRWIIHGLFFYPIVLRFIWGMTALCGTLWAPGWRPAWAMVDRNHPFTGLLFDLTGVMIIFGVVSALVHGARRDRQRPASLPGRDRATLLLIGAVATVGFLLEGARIAMTGSPPGAGWAFVGYLIGLPVSHAPFLTSVYGALWYAHAVLAGAWIAYVPFSRMIHIIMAPVALALNGVSGRGHGKEVVRGR